MAVQYLSYTTATADYGGGSGNLSVGVPSGLTTDDLWMISTGIDIGAAPSIGIATGFSAVSDAVYSGTAADFPWLRSQWKKAGASESAVDVSITQAYETQAASMRFSGQDLTTPIGNTNTGVNDAGGTTPQTVTPGAITIGADGSMVLEHTGFSPNGFTSAAVSPSSGYTEVHDFGSSSNFCATETAYKAVNAGTETPGSVSCSVANGTATIIQLISQVIEIKAAAATGPQVARPDADISDGAWTPSTGADLYATIDEASASDADYNTVTSNSTFKVGLSALSTPGAGTQTFRLRAAGSAAKKLVARVLEGANARATITVDPLTGTVTDYSATASGITDYSALDMDFAISDATSPPAPSVTFGAIGTSANGGASVAPSYPTGITAGQYLTCVVTSGATNSETPSTPSGWTLLATGASTDGTFGIDTGPRRVTVFGKTADGTESGTLTVNITNGNTCRGSIIRWTKSQSSYTWDVVGQGANDSTSGTGFSATTAAISWAPGDAAMATVGQRVDSATQSSQSLTASGITFGTMTNRASTAVTTGNDHRHVIDTFAAVTAGTASVATTWAYTASASVSGGLVVVRLREVPPTEFGRVTWAEFEVPAAGGSQNYSGAMAEGFTLTDVAAAVAAFGMSQAESLTLTDAGAGSQGVSRSQAESVTVTDATSGGAAQSAAELESVTVTDASASTAAFSGAQAESATLTDVSASTAAFGKAQAESVTLADTGTGAWASSSAQAESLTLADAVAFTGSANVDQAEAVTPVDTGTGSKGSSDASSESVTLSDTSSGTMASSKAQAEAITPTDTETGVAAFSSAAAESFTPTDASTRAYAASGAQAEALTATDAATGVAAFLGAEAEALTLTEASTAGGQSAAQAESITITDLSDRQHNIAAAIAEAISLTDASAKTLQLTSSVGEALSMSEAAAAVSSVTAAMLESVTLLDAGYALLNFRIEGDRVLTIKADDRTLRILVESRTLQVDEETRTLILSGDLRSLFL